MAVLLLALALRLLAMLPVNFHHPDEVWQYLEPAYHLAFGHWVVAWEYRDGIRTWLIPAMLAGPMWLGNLIDPGSQLYLTLPRLLLVLLSLSIVVSATMMGLRLSRLHAAMAGLVMATWAELLYFSSRAMSEPVSVALFLPAALLLTGERERRSRMSYLAAGILLGLCFSVRFQLAPALAVLALWACGARWRAWSWLVAGALLGLGLDAVVDALVGGHPPLRWIYENFRINLVEKKSASFGTEPWYWYLQQIGGLWKYTSLVLVPLIFLGARRYPVLLAVALVNVLAHSLIPHKEYRFILLSAVLLVLLAAIGSADLMLRWAHGDQQKLRRNVLIGIAFWCLASWLLAYHSPLKRFWKSGRPLIEAMQLAGADPKACGLALYQPPYPLTANYVYYHRDTPIYLFNTPEDRGAAMRYRGAFDTVLSLPGVGALSPEYALLGCTSKEYCVYRRPGECSGTVPEDYDGNVALERLGK
ncbi:hypothetical protein [Pseudoxanthomonas sp.]|uniref:hypothetical protein n=1 Tax=Pseudoxanthomonas sp. TaxID=1871049 RepID=UPI00262A60E4|nr:hypothetical protein [Pseudoxanthomonas sp.]WDS38107.1 MAG: hypothetical protein O8I58_07515 [Pseudoxanthomonas sp.]